jgi:hypothetical protein
MQIRAKDIARFEKIALQMDAFLKDLQKRVPEANIYFANDTWNLMSGSSHDDYSDKPRRDRVVSSILVSSTSGGDW